MLLSIKDYIASNYPNVNIVSAEVVIPTKKADDEEEFSPLKFYDVTFEYKGKRFSKLFHTRLRETIDQQFKEVINRMGIQIP